MCFLIVLITLFVFNNRLFLQNTVQNNLNKTIKSNERSFESVIKSVPSEVIKSMLLSEVNSFQKDFFELLQKCKRVNIEVHSFFINTNMFLLV